MLPQIRWGLFEINYKYLSYGTRGSMVELEMVFLSIAVLEAAAGVLLSWVDVRSWSGVADLSCVWQWNCTVDRSTRLVCHIHDVDVGPNFAATCNSGHTARMWSLHQQSQSLAHPLTFPLGIVNTTFNSKNYSKSLNLVKI